MKSFFFILFVLFIGCALSDQNSPIVQCPGYNFDNLQDRINISPCGKTRCKLRKGTDITVEFRFKPTTRVETLNDYVYAQLGGLPLPFIGVTGMNACPSVKNADDGSPAPCPLEPNKEYTYTNVIHVEPFYPEVKVQVHWALNDGAKNVICFEVPAAITPAPKKG